MKRQPRPRNSAATRKRILDAVGAVLAESGFQGIGINSIARAAGVDKVLIYRYFGGLPALLRAYADQGSFWPTVSEQLGSLSGRPEGSSLVGIATELLTQHLRALRKRPRTQEIMRWELQQRNELTEELARAREKQGAELVGLLPVNTSRVNELDALAMAAIVHAGITYLVLRSKTADVYMGVDLGKESGWKRIEAAVGRIVEAVLGGR
jgi:AcrR family transcriptional regulator